MGDIGEKTRPIRIEEPMPEHAPITDPSPSVPEKVPA